ncbi:MAG: efflux transporter outer membrane subunit [Alphaproteobacteria bacterium]|nr:MAG: efflux transporter outer membrane subunit [Alphaproteobacteria bacterium]
MKNSKIALLGVGALMAGCSWLEPRLTLPKFMVPDSYNAAGQSTPLDFVNPSETGSWQVAEARVAEPRGNWWEIYNDPQLNELMQQALVESPNLQVMAARVKQARAQAGLAESALWPMIYGDASVTRQRLAPGELQQSDNATSKPLTTHRVGLTASYELDLFGRLTGDARQARFASLAQEDLYESTKLSLQADVVQAYFAARTAGVVLADISETLTLGEKSLKLSRRMHELGDISSQQYQQNVADLMTLRNDALDVQRQRLAASNQLALLLGKMPGSVVISDTTALQTLPPMIPAGVPASLLERRPDVAAAQNQLKSANAGIGAARAAFFPRIELTGMGGYAAQDMSNLFKSNTASWSVGPALTLPIFQGATNLSNLRRSWGLYEESVAAYKQQVLAAFADVDDALAGHRITLEQASGQQQARIELDKTSAMAERQLELGDIGVADYNQIRQQALIGRINEQQTLYNAYAASAQLVRALGGGWETKE